MKLFGGRLKLIFHLKEPLISTQGIDVIVVPGPFAHHNNKRREVCSWLKPLAVATENDTRVFYFIYDLEPENCSIWQNLIAQGLVLLNTVKALHSETKTQHRPIMFICESLGGIVLKQALNMAHQSDSRETTLEHVTSGIIFLSTPHSNSIQTGKWDNWKWIAKSFCKDSSRASCSNEDASTLAEVCQNFESLDLQIPVLSVFENSKSKIRESFLKAVWVGGTNRRIFVDQRLCETGLKYEQTFSVTSEHSNVWLVQVGSAYFQRLVKFMRSITEQAPANIAFLFDKTYLDDMMALHSTSSVSDSGPYIETPQSFGSRDGAAPDVGDSVESVKLENLANFKSPVRGGRVPTYLMSGHSRNLEFCGRKEVLDQIDKALFPASDPNVTGSPNNLRNVVLCGLGGIGKTELANEYAWSSQNKFQAIFWVNSDTVEKINLGFGAISQALGLEDISIPKDDIATREIVKGWLSKPIIVSNQGTPTSDEEACWLLIFDNADDPDSLIDFWPTNGTGCILVTSRNPLSKDTIYSPTLSIDVAPFHPYEARSLLQSLSQREYEDNSLELCGEIAELLGGLPLAIIQMGGIIRRRQLTLEDFLIYYQENAKKLHEMRIPIKASRNYKQTISTVWMFDALGKPALALLRVLSLLDPDRIQEKLLIGDTTHVDLPDYPQTKVAYYDARTELLQSSLISRDTKTGGLRIHRLVQEVVREQLTGEERRAVFETAITLLCNCWPFIHFDERNLINRLNVCGHLFPHVESIRLIFGGDIQSGGLQPSDRCASLFNEAAWYMVERADDEKCGLYASLSLDILSRRSDEQVQNNEDLNRLLSQSHQYKAVSCIFTDSPGGLDHLKIMISLIVYRLSKWNKPEDALQLADAYNESAMAYMRIPDEEKAIKSWIQSYDAFGAVPGSTIDAKIRQEWPAIHLGTLYALRNERQNGEGVLLPVLEARDEKFGKDAKTSMVTGKILHVLGDLRRGDANSTEALELFQRALSIFRATIGDNHYITADTCYRLAEQLIRTKAEKDHEANLLLEQSLKVYGNIRWYKPQASRSAFMKGKLLKKMGNDVEGNAQIKRAMDLRREIVPDDKRSEEELAYDDFDSVIYFMSR